MRASIAAFFSKVPKWVWGGLIGVALFWVVVGTLQFINLRTLDSMPPDERGRSQFTVYGVAIAALLPVTYVVQPFKPWSWGLVGVLSSLPYSVLGAMVGSNHKGCALIGGAIWLLMTAGFYVILLFLASYFFAAS